LVLDVEPPLRTVGLVLDVEPPLRTVGELLDVEPPLRTVGELLDVEPPLRTVGRPLDLVAPVVAPPPPGLMTLVEGLDTGGRAVPDVEEPDPTGLRWRTGF
jgi:hypothetical protein